MSNQKNTQLGIESTMSLEELYKALSNDPNVNPTSVDQEVFIKAPYLRDSRDVGH